MRLSVSLCFVSLIYLVAARSSSTVLDNEITSTYELVNCLLKLDSCQVLVGTDHGLYHIWGISCKRTLQSRKLFKGRIRELQKVSDSTIKVRTELECMTVSFKSNRSALAWNVVSRIYQAPELMINETFCVSHYEVSGNTLAFINGDVVWTDEGSFFSEKIFEDIANKIKLLGGFDRLTSVDQFTSKEPSELVYFRYIYDNLLLAIFSRHGISYYFNSEMNIEEQQHENGFYALHFINSSGGPKPVRLLRFSAED